MATPIPDEKCLVLIVRKHFILAKNTAGYHPGPVESYASNGASFLLDLAPKLLTTR